MVKFFLLIGLSILNLQAFSQDYQWAKCIGKTGTNNNYVSSNGIITDNVRNIYTTGSFSDTLDFNPGAGVNNLTGTGGYVLKLDSAGNFSWVTYLTATGLDIKIDAQGNLYVLQANSISKLNASGNIVWVKSISPTFTSFKLDLNANIITAGYYTGTKDFDPSSNVNNLISVGAEDVFVSKYDSAGNFVWAKSMGGTNTDKAQGLALDDLNNICLTGSYAGTADFDPSAATYNLTSTGSNNVFVIKLNSNGNFIWAINDAGWNGISIAFDTSNNVLFLSSNGFSKLNPSGALIWHKNLGGYPYDRFSLDATGNIYLSRGGTSNNFEITNQYYFLYYNQYYSNPNFTIHGVFTGSTPPGYSFFQMRWPPSKSDYSSITKYNQSGDFVWGKNIANSFFASLTFDNLGNLITIGNFRGFADLDPIIKTINTNSTFGQPDASGYYSTYKYYSFVLKYNTNSSSCSTYPKQLGVIRHTDTACLNSGIGAIFRIDSVSDASYYKWNWNANINPQYVNNSISNTFVMPPLSLGKAYANVTPFNACGSALTTYYDSVTFVDLPPILNNKIINNVTDSSFRLSMTTTNSQFCKITLQRLLSNNWVTERTLVIYGTDTTITNLLPGTYYNILYELSSKYCGIQGGYPTNVYTKCKAPISLFANNITTNGFKANWTVSSGSDSSLLDVSTDRNFTSFVNGYNALSISNDSNKSITGLTSGVRYYYRLRALNSAGISVNSLVDSVMTLPINGTLALKAYLQGLYLGNGTMIPSPFSANGTSPRIIADTITVELRGISNSHDLVYSVIGFLDTSGNASLSFPSNLMGNSYYVVVKHRNSITTWSANAIPLSANTNFNFTNSVNSAFGDNLVDDGTGKYLIYSGDINQDGAVDFNDYPYLDIASNNGLLGYDANDINGDASVDFNDYPILDTNSNIGVIEVKP